MESKRSFISITTSFPEWRISHEKSHSRLALHRHPAVPALLLSAPALFELAIGVRSMATVRLPEVGQKTRVRRLDALFESSSKDSGTFCVLGESKKYGIAA